MSIFPNEKGRPNQGLGFMVFFESESDFCILPPSTPYEALTELKELSTYKSNEYSHLTLSEKKFSKWFRV